jgi:hypothetical protein
MTPEQLQLLKDWNAAKNNLNYYKDAEMTLRKQIVAEFTDPLKDSGTENVDMPAGYTLKIEKSLDYKLDKDKVDEALAHFDDTTADVLVKWSPTLSVSFYKQLTPEKQALFNGCLTIKPSAPTVTIVEPKVKK